ncbi:glycerophosphodiester phosphodiesterase family protein [Planococcus shenhongbingii]|uniref:Glycerophosphodiester phosphodiesterase family protein n=1 Tax=Planococcus shenhongbingii TaxID=3058398 RepID=A0ABT8NC74_9BACL|nr:MULTISPECIES: glycerophosphodiester phosphodiesterase family protein [unclassified Planococcus (in: firmicutes)]MDN7245150.1 glycerophosphodiester phosphodiesterase family protein [Planococcus sp. N017]WKA58245.1 glycerophosphodiester phosphodiesterase family protein [Planococcus sp. N016]
MGQLIAHRGWSGKAPENTLSAIQLALEEPKIDSIEIDVHLTKDGVPVVIHDHKVDRTTNGSGYVKDMTAAEIRALDAGSWFGPEFAGEKVPTLEEVLELTSGGKKLLIELKQTAGVYAGLEEKVIVLIQQYGAQEQCQLISFDHKSLQTCLEFDAQVKRTLVMSGSPLLLIDQVNEIGASAVSVNHQYVDSEMVESLHGNGTDIIVWTVDHKAEAERIQELDGSIALTTNHPERLWI